MIPQISTGNQSALTRLTLQIVSLSYYHWYEYMDRQPVRSTRLTSRAVSLSYYHWYEYMDRQPVRSTRLTLQTVSLSYYHWYISLYESVMSLEYRTDPVDNEFWCHQNGTVSLDSLVIWLWQFLWSVHLFMTSEVNWFAWPYDGRLPINIFISMSLTVYAIACFALSVRWHW